MMSWLRPHWKVKGGGPGWAGGKEAEHPCSWRWEKLKRLGFQGSEVGKHKSARETGSRVGMEHREATGTSSLSVQALLFTFQVTQGGRHSK